jgi:preprotein translocase SecE subunit
VAKTDQPASGKPKKRVVKKAETVRQAAEQNNAKPAKRGILRLTAHYIAVPLKPIFRPVAKLGRFKPFRIIGKILVPTYFRNSWKELRQVTWPGRKESLQLTLAVIIFAIVFGLMIALVDYGLDKLFKEVLLK